MSIKGQHLADEYWDQFCLLGLINVVGQASSARHNLIPTSLFVEIVFTMGLSHGSWVSSRLSSNSINRVWCFLEKIQLSLILLFSSFSHFFLIILWFFSFFYFFRVSC